MGGMIDPVETLASDGGLGDVEVELIHELAKVIWNSEDATTLVLRVGLPTQHVPCFRTPLAFWTTMIQAAREQVPGGVPAIAEEAAKWFPMNPTFAEYGWTGAGTSRGPELRLADASSLGDPPVGPYPILSPYDHPATFAGREAELDDFSTAISDGHLIYCVYAPSGAGKSSFVRAGVRPRLAVERPVALIHDSDDYGSDIAAALLGRLLVSPRLHSPSSEASFLKHLRWIKEQAGCHPVFILDQFEKLFRYPEPMRIRRATAGRLLAATANRLSSDGTFPCRWVLVYREEFHGEICRWLGDVTRDSIDTTGEKSGPLAHRDLSRAEYRRDFPLPMVGEGAFDDRLETAKGVFVSIIQKPLVDPRYGKWRFGQGEDERLAKIFAEARVKDASTPLVPELQVVLDRLHQDAKKPDGTYGEMCLPPDPDELLADTLIKFVIRGLDQAFPTERASKRGSRRDGQHSKVLAINLLISMVDKQRRRLPEVPEDEMLSRLGRKDDELLSKLQDQRLLVRVRGKDRFGFQDQYRYKLPHDRLAEAIGRIRDELGLHRRFSLDTEAIEMQQFVYKRTELHVGGDDVATRLPASKLRRLRRIHGQLIWTKERLLWWEAAQRESRKRWRRFGIMAFAAVVILLVFVFIARRFYIESVILREIESRDVCTFSKATVELHADSPFSGRAILTNLREKKRDGMLPMIFAQEHQCPEAVMDAITILAPATEVIENDRRLLGSMLRAVDESRAGEDRVQAAKRAIFARFPPPPSLDLDWVPLRGGSLVVRVEDRVSTVQVPAFEIMRTEVSSAQYSLFAPDHPNKGRLPAEHISWFEAYAYSRWVGASLPTVEQWEYACLAGGTGDYGLGLPSVEDGWLDEKKVKEVGTGPSNGFGLHEMHGNVSEWCANEGGVREGVDLEPMRGGSYLTGRGDARCSSRFEKPGDEAFAGLGFRLARTLQAGPVDP